MFENLICNAIGIVVVLVIGVKLGHMIERGGKELEEDTEQALKHQERRNDAIEKLDDWLDTH